MYLILLRNKIYVVSFGNNFISLNTHILVNICRKYSRFLPVNQRIALGAKVKHATELLQKQKQINEN